MFDPDRTIEFYGVHDEVECPTCGYTERDVPDVLGWRDNPRSAYITWAHHCTACGHEWTETEDLREEP